VKEPTKPVPIQKMSKVMVEELQSDLNNFFDKIKEKPVSISSIAQVYKARTKEGPIIEIKSQIPNIEPLAKWDMWFLGKLA
jgi:ubiquinone biosynthesis protein